MELAMGIRFLWLVLLLTHRTLLIDPYRLPNFEYWIDLFYIREVLQLCKRSKSALAFVSVMFRQMFPVQIYKIESRFGEIFAQLAEVSFVFLSFGGRKQNRPLVMRFERLSENLLGKSAKIVGRLIATGNSSRKKLLIKRLWENRSVCLQRVLGDENNKCQLNSFYFSIFFLFLNFYFSLNNRYAYLTTCGEYVPRKEKINDRAYLI